MVCDKDCKVPTVYLAIFQLALGDKKYYLYCMHMLNAWEKWEQYQMLSHVEQKTNTKTEKKNEYSFIFINSSVNFEQSDPKAGAEMVSSVKQFLFLTVS